jgi:EAL domain-containing protein (putative c-di-GMP-specific phosphodiesterase class I)
VAAPEEVLGEALDRDGLVVMYQPVVELATGRIVTIEALMGLRGAGGHVETPDALLHLAEESGLIVSLGAGMLDLACRQVAASPSGLSWPMSARQLDEPRAADQVLATLAAHQLTPHRLAIEVTERTLSQPSQAARRNLDRLGQAGVRLVVQDFGAGPASLALLRDFTPDAVKLDAGFMVGFGQVPRLTALVEGIVALGRSLGLTVIAQGVADADQVALLQRLGCDQGQGPYLGEPAPA